MIETTQPGRPRFLRFWLVWDADIEKLSLSDIDPGPPRRPLQEVHEMSVRVNARGTTAAPMHLVSLRIHPEAPG